MWFGSMVGSNCGDSDNAFTGCMFPSGRFMYDTLDKFLNRIVSSFYEIPKLQQEFVMLIGLDELR